MAASELGSQANSKTKKRVIIIVVFALVAGMIVLGLGIWYLLKKRSLKGGHTEKEDLELPLFDLVTLTNATKNFSEEDKLGEGGFGPVYKGKLEGGQEIAVKRLSKNSIQGEKKRCWCMSTCKTKACIHLSLTKPKANYLIGKIDLTLY
ncbi:G-type lectin S-receptor-like serine/threonine-protein kinase RKS1 [Thalictrum thalictroides]|uniref:G-type lectin S-receptor-like serine/threonine-protein kinase RKS1 n=1 Tax=Thalictrum thalictroides TaxID=46969 RepID=A0A7J6W3I9_THATH|nr:G-type lectin S-receptor-like serine/threonine-protein kinase RKS1 [Thalictrum thalictroides]